MPGRRPAEAAGLRVGLLTSFLPWCTPAVEAATRDARRGARRRRRGRRGGRRVAAGRHRRRAPENPAGRGPPARHAGWFDQEAERYAPDVRERLERGKALGAAEVEQAQAVVARAAAVVTGLLARFDALLAPAAPDVAPERSASTIDVRGRAVPLRDALLALPVPLTQHGGPALALPAGAVDGLPVGVQLAGRPHEEGLLLTLGAALPNRRAPAEPA
jgi:Asp-tRNA(Asn)/Glu-tRNA(Gln) amidotransferase A subunit family amidase